MFKVSLLPASYRKSLISKKRKDLIEKVAVIVLFCLLIVYAGIAARYMILNAQIKKVAKQNAILEAQIEELQQYKVTYDELQAAQARVDAIKARDVSAMEFISMVQAARPENIQITAISTQNWQNTAVCVITGELPSALTLRSAVNELNAYAKTFKEMDVYQGCVKQVEIANNGMPVQDQTETYTFTIVVSLTDAVIEFDENGILMTTEPTTAEETTAAPAEGTSEGETAENSAEETTTAPAEETSAEAAEDTTAAAEG